MTEGQIIAAFIAIDVAGFAAMSALIGALYYGILNQIKGIAESQRQEEEKSESALLELTRVRASLADHLRWSRGEHRKIDRQFKGHGWTT